MTIGSHKVSGTIAQSVGLGIVLMITAAMLSTGLAASAKWLLTNAAMPLLQVVALRYLVHFALASALFLPRNGLGVFHSNAPWQLILRSAFLVLGTVLNFLALKYLPLTLNTAILFAVPIVITILSIPILGERIGIHRVIAVLLGFAGVLVIVQPGGAGFQPAVLFSVGAVIAASLYYVM